MESVTKRHLRQEIEMTLKLSGKEKKTNFEFHQPRNETFLHQIFMWTHLKSLKRSLTRLMVKCSSGKLRRFTHNFCSCNKARNKTNLTNSIFDPQTSEYFETSRSNASKDPQETLQDIMDQNDSKETDSWRRNPCWQRKTTRGSKWRSGAHQIAKLALWHHPDSQIHYFLPRHH